MAARRSSSDVGAVLLEWIGVLTLGAVIVMAIVHSGAGRAGTCFMQRVMITYETSGGTVCGDPVEELPLPSGSSTPTPTATPTSADPDAAGPLGASTTSDTVGA